MAKTNRRPSDKFERKARLAQRVQMEDAIAKLPKHLNRMTWIENVDELEDIIAEEISSARTNRAY